MFKSSLQKFLALVLVIAFSVSSVSVVSARTYPDNNLNPDVRPNDNMRVDEFIAMLSHVSYWSTGADAPYTKDKNGNTASAWAAPYVQSEINKGVVDASTISYSDPATIAFAAKYLSNARGLYHWDFENTYTVANTDGLSAEDRMYLNVAFDNKLITYYSGISAKTVLKRKDVNSLLLNKPFTKIATKTYGSDNSVKNIHVFFENNSSKAEYEFNCLKKYSSYITQVSFGGTRSLDSSGNPVITYDKPQEEEAIKYCTDNGIQTFLFLDNYNFFSENGGYSVYDQDAAYSMINNADGTISSVIQCMNKYGMDGINVTFDMYGGNQYRAAFSAFLQKLNKALKNQNKLLMVSVGAYIGQDEEETSIYDYEAIGQNSDYVHIILYDENSANAFNTGVISQPGCNSSLTYIDRVLKYASYRMDPQKILLGTQSYAVSFGSTKGSAKNVDFNTAWPASSTFVYNSTEGSGHVTENGNTIYFETEAGMQQRAYRTCALKLSGMSSFSLTSDSPYVFSTVNNLSSARKEVISAMRKKLVPVQYYNAYENGIRRDEFCDFIVRFIEVKSGKDIQTYLKERNVTVNTGKFTDTSSYNVAVANALGIVNGRSANTFGLEVIKRQEAASMLAALAKEMNISSTGSMSFNDTSQLASWAQSGIAYTSGLVDKTNNSRVMNGTGNNNFSPYGVYTRSQTMMTMVRLYNAG